MAQSLDYSFYPALPVIIPDAVFHEATFSAGKLGAQEILDWYRDSTDQVRVEPTDIFREEMVLRETMPGRKPARDLGERAAIEIVRNYPLSNDARTLLLSDDRDAVRLLVFEPGMTRHSRRQNPEIHSRLARRNTFDNFRRQRMICMKIEITPAIVVPDMSPLIHLAATAQLPLLQAFGPVIVIIAAELPLPRPTPNEFAREVAALRAFYGPHMPRRG